MSATKATVVLLHGLWLNAFVMGVMRRRLERGGYAVYTYSYPSVRLALTEVAERVARFCDELPAGPVHFVGHSMGGLVALKAAALVPQARRGRVVLVGTPYADSYSARRLSGLPGGHKILGRSIAQWLSEPRPVAPEGSEIGVIAGSLGIGLGRLIAPQLPKPNDGVVTVAETEVPGMRDQVVLPVGHSQMLISAEVARQACAFLGLGRFERKRATSR